LYRIGYAVTSLHPVARRYCSQPAELLIYSTETAMSKVVNDLLLAVGGSCPSVHGLLLLRSPWSVLLSLHISAAFDTLNHRRLLDRAEELFGVWPGQGMAVPIPIRAIPLCIVRLAKRSATVSCDSVVPQGSALDPLLFCIFTTPISSVMSDFNTAYHQYAVTPLICNYTHPSVPRQTVSVYCLFCLNARTLQ